MKRSISFFLCVFFLSAFLGYAQKQPERIDGKAPRTYNPVVKLSPEDVATVYPQSSNYWTGSTNSTTKTETSLIKGYNTEDGWMVFDVSSIPDGSTINSVTFNGYVNATYWPYWYVTPLSVDPRTASASDVYTALQSGTTNYYHYGMESSSFTTGWKAVVLNGSVNADLTSALVNDWFAVGIVSSDNSTTYYINFDGWNETNKPYLEVDYIVPLEHDVSTVSVDISNILPIGVFTPKATFRSNSTVSETFDVKLDIVSGSTNVYTSTKTVTNLAPGASIQISFDNATLDLGTYTATACTQLGNDPNSSNNCLDKNFSVQDLIPIYAYNAYDPSPSFVEGPVYTSVQQPEVLTLLSATTSADFIAGGTWADGTWYGVEYSTSSSNLWTINDSTGAMTLIGPCGFAFNGLAYDITTDVLYAVSSTALYTVNKTSGAATLVGSTGTTTAINLACSQSGQLYTVDINDDNLYSLNKTTGARTLIGSIGFDASYAQSMDFDLDTDICYMAAYNATAGRGELRIMNVTNGSTTLLGVFQNDAEITGFAIPYNRAIPVELTSFAGSVNGTSVTLNWSTATETNNSGFQIERNNGNGFEAIDFVSGFGTVTEIKNYTYVDENLNSGRYSYRLKQIDFDGTFEYSNIVEVEIVAPSVFALDQNYPNPFNPSTTIKFSLATDSKVSLKIFDVLGQEVSALINGQLPAGTHSVNFNAAKINSGVYFYKIEADGIDGQKFSSTKKMILTK